MSHDLFGQIAVPAHDSIEAGLVRKDEATRQERASRWQFREDVRDGGEITYIGRIEGAYLFREAELAFVDGHFAATVVLAHAVIEWMLRGWLMDQERFAEARMGMRRLLRFAEESGLLDAYLVREIDKLRRKRNHFSHFKTDDEDMQLGTRLRSTGVYDPHALVQRDAEEALRLLHQLYRTTPRKIKVQTTSRP